MAGDLWQRFCVQATPGHCWDSNPWPSNSHWYIVHRPLQLFRFLSRQLSSRTYSLVASTQTDLFGSLTSNAETPKGCVWGCQDRVCVRGFTDNPALTGPPMCQLSLLFRGPDLTKQVNILSECVEAVTKEWMKKRPLGNAYASLTLFVFVCTTKGKKDNLFQKPN